MRPLLLTETDPVVWLTRLQSGIGRLTIQAAVSNEVGDLRLACAYRLSDGLSGLAVNREGLARGPLGNRPAVVRVHRDRFDTVTIDCRRVREIDRFLVLAFSASDAQLAWGGTLILTTLGGSKVEVSLDAPRSAGAVGLITAYQVDGEFVVRAERHVPSASIRQACLDFGFDTITWLDARTPIGSALG
jgi:hypothetical protein